VNALLADGLHAPLYSPDKEKAIYHLRVDGRDYDIPSWVPVTEFLSRVAQHQKNDGDPLSSLLSLKFKKWEFEEYDKVYNPVFVAKWLIPWNSARELVVNVFTPDRMSNDELKFKATDAGVELKFKVREYTDFNDVQAILIPEVYGDLSKLSSDEWVQELVTEFENDPENFERWHDVRILPVKNSGGTSYKLIVNFHED